MIILGFDPGRDKCGVALVSQNLEVLWHQVVPSKDAIATIQQLIKLYEPAKIVMGNQTTSKQWQQKLTDNLSPAKEIELVDERNSTVEAKQRYWQMYPPQGLSKLIPQGMRVPPRPIDDIVAILLVERHVELIINN